VRKLVLLLLTTTAACTVNSGVKTTPTFVAARPLPPEAIAAPTKPKLTVLHDSDNAEPPGPRTVMAANRESTVEPTGSSMQGASWVIEQHDASMIYRVPVQTKRVTTLLLPAGEKFNGAMGGDVEGFLINVAYAGPRPAVSILPRMPGARGNLQLATTGGLYSFDLVTSRFTSVNLVDIGRGEAGTPDHRAAASPQPEGDFTRLSFRTPSGAALPAWAPTEAWADSVKMVVRFQGPLPVLPALFAGQQGEQIVAYKTVYDQGSPLLVTNRRVTEAELRLDEEVVALTVDTGAPADPNPHGWRQAEVPPAVGPAGPVAVFVMPGMDAGVAAAVQSAGVGIGQEPKQPMANHVISPGI
jgi:conjugative transfer protein CagX